MAVVLTLRFLTELALFVSVAWWGSQQFSGIFGLLAAAGLVVALAVTWGVLLSPRARIRMPSLARVLVEVLLFGLAALALSDLGRPWWGAVLLAGDLAIIAALAVLRKDDTGGWSPHDVQGHLP